MGDTWIPVISGVGGVLLGSLVAGIFGLVGPSLQGRREHARWLRESRLTAYGDFLSAIDLWMDASAGRWVEDTVRGKAAAPDRETALADDVARTQSRVVLIGPDPVRFAAVQYHHLVLDHIEAYQTAESLEAVVAVDVSELQRARGDLLGIMNRTLGIGPL